mgnify:FL=1|jgi:hypothetical protein
MALWEAREATVNIGTTLATVEGSVTLLSQVSSTDFSGECKSISITGGERDVDVIPLLGTTSGFANQEAEEKSIGSMREISMTLVYKDGDTSAFATGTVATSGAASTYTRIQGDLTRTKKAVLVSFNSGSDYVNCLLNDAYSIKIGDISLDADGHAEQEIVFKCLSKDYYEEDNL